MSFRRKASIVIVAAIFLATVGVLVAGALAPRNSDDERNEETENAIVADGEGTATTDAQIEFEPVIDTKTEAEFDRIAQDNVAGREVLKKNLEPADAELWIHAVSYYFSKESSFDVANIKVSIADRVDTYKKNGFKQKTIYFKHLQTDTWYSSVLVEAGRFVTHPLYDLVVGVNCTEEQFNAAMSNQTDTEGAKHEAD